jgi:hypothetical protein
MVDEMLSHSQYVMAPLVLAGIAIVGCQRDGWDRVVVTGDVSYGGESVQDGQIRFIPTGGTQGPVSIAAITAGQYRCDRAGGVPVGMHRVEILAFDPNAPAPLGPGSPPRKQLLPAKYHRYSTLTAEVAADSGPATVNFDLVE